MINSDYVKNYLIKNKIIFPTNVHDGGHSGFQNYGPIGLKIKNNIIDIWRNNFVNFDKKINIFEIDSPVISTQKVLTRSGHIQKFNDLGIIFKNISTRDIITIKRADHFIEDTIERLGLKDIVYQENIQFVKSFLESNNLYDKEHEYFEIEPISLMFKMDMNSIGDNLYLRPEIAQTIFIEFKQFYDYNNSRLPFGISQVGKSYRNEISEKSFIRLREFTQAEVEYFYNPFEPVEFIIPEDYSNNECLILSNELQINNKDSIKIKLSELDNFIRNPILRMFVFRLYLFAQQIGLDIERLRFRQHKSDEMAHYAKDCWDLEAENFGKWLEITGIADRGDYDLKTHDSKSQFMVKKTNIHTIKYKLTPKAKEIFKQFDKVKAQEMICALGEMILDSKNQLEQIDLTWYNVKEFNDYELIYPYVIEPSIGIDRVFYSLICHNLKIRPDNIQTQTQTNSCFRPYLLLTKSITPYDFALLQLSTRSDLMTKLEEYLQKLSKYNIFTDFSSTTIGKRYTRADELGIINTITIDFNTLKDNIVTIRNIKDMKQIRINFYDIDFDKILN